MKSRKATLSGLVIGTLAVCGATAGELHQTGDGNGMASTVSNNGFAAGSFQHPSGEYFIWFADGGTIAIGGVEAGGGVGGQASISDDGRFISGTTYNAAQDYHEMSRFDVMTGTWTGFGAIPVIGTQIDSEVSSGWGVSGDGTSVAGLGWTTQGTADTHAFQWMDGVGAIDLGTATVGTSARANAIDFDGDVVAGWQDGNGRQGAVWVNGVQELIWKAPGVHAHEALAVSNDGKWAIGIDTVPIAQPGSGTAYRYNIVTDTYEAIPNLSTGAQKTMAGTGITADGATIVGGTWEGGPAIFGTGLIWREGIGTIRFSDYLDEIGIAYPAGYHFNFVSDISPNGEWIVGWGGGGVNPWATETFVVYLGCDSSCDDPDADADVNNDCQVDLSDLAQLLANFGVTSAVHADGDTNGDGVVDLTDLSILLAAFGTSCP